MAKEDTIIDATPFSRADNPKRRLGLSVRPLSIFISAVFILLALAATFLFTAKTVKVTLIPTPETFSFKNGFQYALGGRYLMLPGGYGFSATKSGYHRYDGELAVDDRPNQEFQFTMLKLPGRLLIKTQPGATASVYVDQQLVGTAPIMLDSIAAGKHDIKLKSARFLDYDTEIEIEGLRQLQTLNLALTPAWALLNIQSDPIAADIVVDGVIVAQTPAAIEAIQGERSIEVKKAGYKTWQSSIRVAAGIDQNIAAIVLEKSAGKITINSTPNGATVNINNRYRGQTPLKLALTPGENYHIQISKAGFKSLQRTINLTPDEYISLNNTLKPILGLLRLQIEPADAELYIDGKAVVAPWKQLSLTARPHKIRVSKAGFADHSVTITPRADAAQQMLIRLQTESAAAIAAIPTSIVTAANQTLRLILPGELTMGASRRAPGRRSNEISKAVKLTRPFYLSESEVTNQQYKLYRPGHKPGIMERIRLDGDDRPVVNVTWQEAVAFCNWLSDQAGQPAAYAQSGGVWKAVSPMNAGFRLPTEAEWAWSARYTGHKHNRFPWGNSMPPTSVDANYADESAINMAPYHIVGYNDLFRGPSPVKHFSPNALGIFDLAGNVAEWINDFYSVDIPQETLVDPVGPDKGNYHVIRGSSYQHGRFSELRWTYRDFGIDGRADVGFRVARYLE